MAARYDALVVGAGYAGTILAERLATECGYRVLVVDRRDHIAGNAFDEHDEHGVLVHRYGPHIFHTRSQKVVDYLSRFTDWRPYEHRVLARIGEQELPIPINRTTLNALYGLDLRSEEDAERFYAARAEPTELVRTSEDSVVAKVGRELYELFFRGYTTKQWGRDPADLHASVCARIPVRTTTDDRYFTDWFQRVPAEGYTAMFRRMLDHPNIEVRVGTDFDAVRDDVEHGLLVYTGPIDAYFEHCYGALPYRSLSFELRTEPTLNGELKQAVAQVNYPSLDVPWTRITEFRHITGQLTNFSTLAVEYPQAEGDPYYPVPHEETRELYKRYERLAATRPDVVFVGRLARYQYLNMDQVVGQALAAFEHLRADGRAIPLAA